MKVIALSKEFFLCGWNIFDLCIVTASILDLIFELVDGLSVLRGLRLVSLRLNPQILSSSKKIIFSFPSVKSFEISAIVGHHESTS